MVPGINPRQMQGMMRKMGINQVDVVATEVIIKTPDKDIVITDPQVSRINMMGKYSFQVSGNITERIKAGPPVEINDDDIKTVAEQANVSLEDAKKAIEKANGDLAEAILNLTS